jgi:hypothetical protein
MSNNPEVDKAVNQLETQRPPVEDAAKVLDNAVGVYTEPKEFYEDGPNTPPEDHSNDEAAAEAEPDEKPAKKTAAKKTSGNRAAKNSTAKKE